MTESNPPVPSLDADPEIVALRLLDAQLAVSSGQIALSAVTIEHLKIVFGTTASFSQFVFADQPEGVWRISFIAKPSPGCYGALLGL